MSDLELSADEFRALYDRVKHMSRWRPADRHLMDWLQFDDLVAVCEELNRWTFLCVVAPLRLPAATGSPVNPITIF
jgi:hypothetical protein